MCHGQLYQQRMKKAFDKKVKPRVFREGDLVLKKVLSFAPDSRGKWTPNYEGPYVVKRAFSGGALMLTTIDGEDFTRPVNSGYSRISQCSPEGGMISNSIVASRVLWKTSFVSPAAIFPSMGDFLGEVSAVVSLSSWCPVTFSSGSPAPDFICLLSTVTSGAVIDIPIRVASRVVVTLPSAVASGIVCFLSTIAFFLKDSVSQRFDTRYFTFSPAKSSAELLLSLHQSLFSSAEQDLFSYSVVDWVDIPVFQPSSLSVVCRAFVVAVLPAEYSFNPQYGRMMALASRERIDFLTVCDPQ
ncbi:hypothetical protein KIW84_052650 [Lathyrus oleraceus]|uniref:Uncharacterized protein n=1 Tax=Pisum sativum TaxID=3888 RepID=A0A9D4WQX4_PEA|nr:hypothetical protein KIW84_052650 [Pisum sativum]